MPIGNYTIKIIGTLPDLVSIYSDNFNIIIIKQIEPPYFTNEKP